MRTYLSKLYHWSLYQLRPLKFIYWKFINLGYYFRILKIENIPILIINYNRLSFPLMLIESLERLGYRNIVIIDNKSSYPPLLKYYKTCKYKVINLDKNWGCLAFWKSGIYHDYKWNYFVLTDSDVVPINKCPSDFLGYFKKTLDHYYTLDKFGFGLQIDDLPDVFTFKEKVIRFEKEYWKKEVASNIYDAPIDTTFAVYKPFSYLRNSRAYTMPAYRTGFPYLLKHMPWYVDTANMSEEEKFYLNTCDTTSSIGNQFKKNDLVSY